MQVILPIYLRKGVGGRGGQKSTYAKAGWSRTWQERRWQLLFNLIQNVSRLFLTNRVQIVAAPTACLVWGTKVKTRSLRSPAILIFVLCVKSWYDCQIEDHFNSVQNNEQTPPLQNKYYRKMKTCMWRLLISGTPSKKKKSSCWNLFYEIALIHTPTSSKNDKNVLLLNHACILFWAELAFCRKWMFNHPLWVRGGKKISSL